jgi:hypothetical protein
MIIISSPEETAPTALLCPINSLQWARKVNLKRLLGLASSEKKGRRRAQRARA